MEKKQRRKLATVAGGILIGAIAGSVIAKRHIVKKAEKKLTRVAQGKEGERQAYLIGGGLGSMAAAVYLLQDGGFTGENIHIIEGMDTIGGCNAVAGDPIHGYVCYGSNMLHEETYENFWDLFATIPSLEWPGKSVTEEIWNFDHLHPTHAQARLIDARGVIQDSSDMQFHHKDRYLLLKLLTTSEEKLDHLSIEQWFQDSPHFFTTNFWYLWQTTYAFQKWSSVFEFRRYLYRMMSEVPRMHTLEGVTQTPKNPYDSLILPITTYLVNAGVDFSVKACVTDIEFEDESVTATALQLLEHGKRRTLTLQDEDLCILCNGSMRDCATLGDLKHPAMLQPTQPRSGDLWKRLADKKPALGNPTPFFANPEETNWESFTITCKGTRLLNMLERFSGNIPGSGALMSFPDSKWLLSMVVPVQPYFKDQPQNTTVLWGYGLSTNVIGDYIKKPMRECTGEELLLELLGHLHFEEDTKDIMDEVVNVIPCMMPYVDAPFQPRAMSDRPRVVPAGSTNFAMVSQFVELPEDIVFTEEYSVRAARTAVYTLLGINKKICPVTAHHKHPKVASQALKTIVR